MSPAGQFENSGKSLIVIGAGIAGLSAGCYARMNGYKTVILEMHNLPGGLCTAWKRKGYTIDGCMHWLLGSSPESGFHKIWSELGAIQGRKFVEFDEFLQVETTDGKTVRFHASPERLEEHLSSLFPDDAKQIRLFCRAVTGMMYVELPVEKAPETMGALDAASMLVRFGTALPGIIKWGRITLAGFCEKFRSPGLREAFLKTWLPETSMLFVVFTFAWLANRTAAYPIGGSLPFAGAIEKRFCDLGGTILYKNRVKRFEVSGDRISGVETADGAIRRADWFISAADAHSTIFEMLGEGFVTDGVKAMFDTPLFPPLVYAGFGVDMDFNDFPRLAAGRVMQLKEPLSIAGRTHKTISLMVENFDPTLAPPGKTVLKVMLDTDYDWWKELSRDRGRYLEEKSRIEKALIGALEARFPGISAKVEMADIATPCTFERYTGNYRASFEGFQVTPKNVFKPAPKTVEGISNLLLCGQWLEAGGGLPAVAMSGRNVIQIVCKKDGLKFKTSMP